MTLCKMKETRLSQEIRRRRKKENNVGKCIPTISEEAKH